MKKEFQINEILGAIDSLSKMKKKKHEIIEKKDYQDKNNALILNKKAKSNESEILVLNQMIE